MASFFYLIYATKQDLCSVPYEPLAISDGDGGSAPRKSLECAGESLSEEGKGSCCSQWKKVYFERDLAKDLPVAANKVVSEDDYMVLVLLHILMCWMLCWQINILLGFFPLLKIALRLCCCPGKQVRKVISTAVSSGERSM